MPAAKKKPRAAARLVRPTWTTACPDWRDRIKRGVPLTPCAPLFPSSAASGMAVFDDLQIVDAGITYGACKPWVLEFAESIFGSYCDVPGHPDEGRRLIKTFFMLISKKNTKALALDTPIPTPSGWTTMGEIEVGDQVIGVDGKPCNVIATSEVYTDHKCYRIGFSNGESVVADAGHLWMTKALVDSPGAGGGNGGDRRQRRLRVRTTQEIANTLLRPNDGARNHSMPMPSPMQGTPVDLPVSPYTFGAWLGDGHSACARITSHEDDVEVRDSIMAEGWPLRFSSNNGSKASTYAISSGDRSQRSRNDGLAATLRRIGVLGNKHIPDVYLRASYEQRLALLQGLMDTDGTVNANGRVFGYTSVNERLIRGVGELLSTFGIKWSLRSEKTIGKDAWTLQFSTFRDEVPLFRLRRKLDRMRLAKPNARSRSVQFVSAEEVAPVPVKCIMVDSQDRQFLFGRTMLPTHNSTIAAGIMLTVLVQNWRPEAEYLILSPTKEIADNSFKPIKAAIEADEELSDLFHVQPHLRQITHKVTKATLKVVAADSQTVSGKKATGVLVDELHEFGKVAKAEDMLVEATGGLMSRPEGFVIYLTTQSSEPPAGVFKKELDYARRVRDGEINDPTYFPIIYEFPDEYLNPKTKPYLREENWYMTNPNLGVSVDLDTLRQKIMKAGESGADSLQSVVSKHLNVQIGLDLGADRWPAADYWPQTVAEDVETLDNLLAASEVVTCGIDGGGLDDLLGLTFTGRRTGTIDRFVSWSIGWVSKKLLETRTEIEPRLRDFERQNHLVIVENVGDDSKQLAQMVRVVMDTGLLAGIGIDPAKIAALQAALVAEGVIEAEPDPKFFIKVRQGWSLYGAMLNVERAMAEGRYEHADQPIMDWNVGNAKVVQRGNAMLVTKEVSGKAKIDLVMSSFNAMELMSYNPPSRTGGYSLDNLTLLG